MRRESRWRYCALQRTSSQTPHDFITEKVQIIKKVIFNKSSVQKLDELFGFKCTTVELKMFLETRILSFYDLNDGKSRKVWGRY